MDRKSRNIFYGVIMVATLIIAIVGATLAYFSYRTSSSPEAIKAHSATLNIVYKDGEQVTAQADLLVPASFDVVKSIYESHVMGGGSVSSSNKCVDDNNKQVCSVYRFSITSDYDRDVYALLKTELNEMTYLVYALRDVSNNTWIKLDKNNYYIPIAKCEGNCYTINGEEKTYSTDPLATNSIFGYNNDSSLKKQVINSNERIFDLVLFIKENNKDQNVDQGKKYSGTITIEATNAINKVISG